jgi:hypothetical protein
VLRVGRVLGSRRFGPLDGVRRAALRGYLYGPKAPKLSVGISHQCPGRDPWVAALVPIRNNLPIIHHLNLIYSSSWFDGIRKAS